jgi:hypothetical protein
MDIQRLRNLTTGKLHTTMSDIYEDIEWFTRSEGIMTHQLPNAARALRAYLEKHLDSRFFDGRYDPSHVGDVEISPMDEAEKREFQRRYAALPSPFQKMREDAEVIVVKS